MASSTRSAAASNANDDQPTNPIRSPSGAPISKSCASSASSRLPASFRSGGRRSTTSSQAHGAKSGEALEAERDHDAHGRPDPRHRELRQGEFSGPVGRQGARSRSTSARTRWRRARLPDLQAARLRRLGRRRGSSVPDQDERVHHLGVEARVPRQVSAAAAGEVARTAGRRDPVSSAVSRPHREPGCLVGCSRCAAASWRRFANS